MECFGVNLERMSLYQTFTKEIEHISKICKKGREVPSQAVYEQVQMACDNMKRIFSSTIAESSNIKNQHNQLFLSLMEQLNRLKQDNIDKIKRKTELLL